MIHYKTPPRYVARSWPGEGTGETVYEDQDGNTYRTVSEEEARQINNSTAGRTARIYSDGSIR